MPVAVRDQTDSICNGDCACHISPALPALTPLRNSGALTQTRQSSYRQTINRQTRSRQTINRQDNQQTDNQQTRQLIDRQSIDRTLHRQTINRQFRTSIRQIQKTKFTSGQVRLGWLPFRCLLASLQVPVGCPFRCLLPALQVPVGCPLGTCWLPFRYLLAVLQVPVGCPFRCLLALFSIYLSITCPKLSIYCLSIKCLVYLLSV